jgi:hypothetical protein
MRQPKVDFIDHKPVAINKFIGRRRSSLSATPTAINRCCNGPRPGAARLMGLVHHTDAEREWAYDRQSHVGRLDKALDEANAKGWTVVDMKRDWRRVFPDRFRRPPRPTNRRLAGGGAVTPVPRGGGAACQRLKLCALSRGGEYQLSSLKKRETGVMR